MAHKLSEGSLEIIMNGGLYDKPIMQVLGSKKILGSGTNERFRLLVSDGKHSHSFAMLATQLNDILISGQLSDYSVVQINKFVTSVLKNTGKGEKRVMIILDVTILSPGTEVAKKLGDPQTWSEDSVTTPAPGVSPMRPVPQPTPALVQSLAKPAAGPNLDSSLLGSQMTHPIASLSPYQNKWVIKARVMNKSPLRTWSNAKGEGKLFSMDLCDESGEIRATAFRNECEKFFDMIQVDKVYFISRCQLKTANKQFTTLKNDYEMTFTPDTVVAECMEDSSSLPTVKYDFVPISDIANKSSDTILDVIGVCKSASDVQELTAKSTGKLLKKREATLVDQSGGAIILTLWGNEAENFDASTNPVVSAKGARLAEFNGSKSLSCLASTMLRCNPDVPEAHRLRGWYDNGGANMETVNISARSGGQSGGSGEWITFSEAEARKLGTGEKGDYFTLVGVLTYMFADNAIYKACPQEQCNKKLVDQENGLFRCEKCNREYPNYKYRLLLGANVSDPTGDQRITAFNEAAETILGQSAADIGRMSEYDKSAYSQLFEDVKFKTFVFNFRTKMETYSDEAKLKTTVMSAKPVDYKDANAKLVKSIMALSGVQLQSQPSIMSIRNGLRRRNTSNTQRDREGVRINVRQRIIRRRDPRRSALRAERIRRPRVLTSTPEGTPANSLNIPVRRSRQRRRNSKITQNVGLNSSVALSLMPDATVRRPLTRARAAAARTRASYMQPRVGPEGDTYLPNRSTPARRQEHRRWLQPNTFRNEHGSPYRWGRYRRNRQQPLRRRRNLQGIRKANRPGRPFTLPPTT